MSNTDHRKRPQTWHTLLRESQLCRRYVPLAENLKSGTYWLTEISSRIRGKNRPESRVPVNGARVGMNGWIQGVNLANAFRMCRIMENMAKRLFRINIHMQIGIGLLCCLKLVYAKSMISYIMPYLLVICDICLLQNLHRYDSKDDLRRMWAIAEM